MSGLLGRVIYAGPPDIDGKVLAITDHAHDVCGWPERINYLNREGDVVNAGCAGCEMDLPIPPREATASSAPTKEADHV